MILAAISRMAADPVINRAGGRDALAAAMRVELAHAETAYRTKSNALADVSGHAAAMFNCVE